MKNFLNKLTIITITSNDSEINQTLNSYIKLISNGAHLIVINGGKKQYFL